MGRKKRKEVEPTPALGEAGTKALVAECYDRLHLLKENIENAGGLESLSKRGQIDFVCLRLSIQSFESFIHFSRNRLMKDIEELETQIQTQPQLTTQEEE